MIRVVLDTNVIVSALLKKLGNPALVLRLALSGQLELYVSAPILAEYEEVLRRPKFSFAPAIVDSTLDEIRAAAKLVKPAGTITASPDENDNRFLECADEAEADYLVTGNKRHFPHRWKRTSVVDAREFLDLIVPDLPQ